MSSDAARVAVVLVEYESGGLVADRAAEAASRGYVPVVADNSGTYDGVGIVVRTPGNVGFGAGCNAAVRAAPDDVDVIVLQNPDADIAQEDLSLLVEAVRSGWSAVAPALIADRVRSSGFRVPQLWREPLLVLRECLAARGYHPRAPRFTRAGSGDERARRHGPRCEPGRFASAALLVVSRAAYEAVGGFDEEFFLYAEDLDLWVRLERAGHPVGFLPEAIAQHVGAGGSDLAVERRIIMRWIGREHFAEKEGRGWPILRAIHLCGLWLLPNRDDLQVRGFRRAMLSRPPRSVQAEIRARLGHGGAADAPTATRVGWSRTVVQVPAGALVLDVGSGAFPNPRADVLCERELVREHRRAVTDRPAVVADVLALPFRAGSFDFVIASHLAEHVKDPTRFGSELMYTARGGYIETPSPLFERLFPTANHRWMVRRTGSRQLTFLPNTRRQGVVAKAGDLLYPWYFAGTDRERRVIDLGGPVGRALNAGARVVRAVATRSGAAVTRVVFSEQSPVEIRVDPERKSDRSDRSRRRQR